jgi:hypothetical protein
MSIIFGIFAFFFLVTFQVLTTQHILNAEGIVDASSLYKLSIMIISLFLSYYFFIPLYRS